MIGWLLDTQPILWALAGDPRLPSPIAAAINDDPAEFGVSDVSVWEIAIKLSTGKLNAPDDLPSIIAELGFTQVPITRRQVWAVGGLPFHHRDPFDRLLISQALDLEVPVVASDDAFVHYGVAVRWTQLEESS